MSESDYKRPQRVGELIKHELANAITNEIKDPRIGFVTVTEVRVSKDLRSARVYVSIYGDQKQRTDSLAGLRTAAGFLKRQIAQRLKLRFVPQLHFEHDETLDHADRINAVMHAIANGEKDLPTTETTAPISVQTYRSELADKRAAAAAAKKEKKKPPRRRRSRW